MISRFVLTSVAVAALWGASLPALSQGRVYDRNASNNPEIYQQTHPEDRSNPQLQGPPSAGPAERFGERGQREAARNEAIRRDQDRVNAQRQDADRRHEGERRHGDRRNRDHRGWDRRDYGYVIPRPFYYGSPQGYYSAPPVYYSAPPVYYGGAPQTYYPYANTAPLMFRQGDYLPPELRSQQFVVADWSWRGLAAPPYGYQWILLGPDSFALVLASTGQIVSLVAAR